MENWKDYCTAQNFLGVGSTRKAYRAGNKVIKVHLHPIGYEQSRHELLIYQEMKRLGYVGYFAEVTEVHKEYAVQSFAKPLELRNAQTYDLSEDDERLTEPYKKILSILDHEFDSFDLKDSGNFGINEAGRLVFIDYGMTKKQYESEWVREADAGVIPQIFFEACAVCGVEKELRIYGKDDQDRRCVGCGKE
ncbi:protein kinase [Jeotgalibacillus salarius]|uniref:Protein kinase n=1 Tax=Jeotgalibacillus salarius TaxID=546023 RepID=A0A4Y8LHQ6_9BACL|nr:protein kinase [Jeotgalibacillus salarius]TFE02274.1 protein kinase [Jeotgalibacillus salarius]